MLFFSLERKFDIRFQNLGCLPVHTCISSEVKKLKILFISYLFSIVGACSQHDALIEWGHHHCHLVIGHDIAHEYSILSISLRIWFPPIFTFIQTFLEEGLLFEFPPSTPSSLRYYALVIRHCIICQTIVHILYNQYL